MIPLSITPNLDLAPWEDCRDLPELATITRIGRLPKGTDKGKSTVAILIVMADGSRVMAQTTLALMSHAMIALCISAEAEGEVIPV